MYCVDCKHYKPYTTISGGECLNSKNKCICNDIEYPYSYGCILWEVKKMAKRGRPRKKKANLIERFIKWITKGKY